MSQGLGSRRTLILSHDKSDQSIWTSIRNKLSVFLWPAVAVFLLIAFTLPAAMYYCIVDLPNTPESDSSTCVITQEYRVPCGYAGEVGQHPIGNVSEEMCKTIKCCFDEHTRQCYHSLPSKYGYRKVSSEIYTRKMEDTPFLTPMFENLSITVITVTNYIKIGLLPITENAIETALSIDDVEHRICDQTLSVDVFRKDRPESVLLQTAQGPLIASDGYWEWTMQLTRKNGQLFGLGGLVINRSLRKVIYRNEADHTTLPIFLAHHEGEFHAVVVEHDGVLEVEVLDSKLIIMRGLNSTRLSLRLFPGPTLNDIYSQRDVAFSYAKMITDVPRWLMGMHMCRNAIMEPLEAAKQWEEEDKKGYHRLSTDSDCFNELFTIFLIENEESKTIKDTLSSVVKTIKSRGKFVLPISPHIPVDKGHLYSIGVEMGVLIKNSLGQVHVGSYKNRKVAFLDFSASRILDYVEKILKLIDSVVNRGQIDAVFLLDNWPQDDNYTVVTNEENLIYYNRKILKSLNKTLPLHLAQGEYSQDNYILKQILVFRKLLPHSIIISSSQVFPMRSPLLPQNVNLTWSNLKAATTSYLFHNTFSHPLSLSPVCGTVAHFKKDFNELCARWFLNAALQPGQRFTKQWYLDENVLGTTIKVADKAITLAKELRYYQYTMFKMSGYTNKPMFMDFYDDNETFALNEQFMVGDLLVRQILLARVTATKVYLPVKHHWYDFNGGNAYANGWIKLSITRDERLIFIKEGSIISLVQKMTKSLEGFTFIVAKRCKMADAKISSKILYDVANLKVTYVSQQLRISNVKQIQKEIRCSDTQSKRKHIWNIKQIIEYACDHEPSYYSVMIDLCTIITDEYLIKYKT